MYTQLVHYINTSTFMKNQRNIKNGQRSDIKVKTPEIEKERERKREREGGRHNFNYSITNVHYIFVR